MNELINLSNVEHLEQKIKEKEKIIKYISSLNEKYVEFLKEICQEIDLDETEDENYLISSSNNYKTIHTIRLQVDTTIATKMGQEFKAKVMRTLDSAEEPVNFYGRKVIFMD